MNTAGHYLDELLFAILPYVAFFTFFLVTIERYRRGRYSYSSLSSQFLENRQHFWSLVPFHYGILAVLAGHILGFLSRVKFSFGTARRCGFTSWRLPASPSPC
jgi:nitrate reductase gamma subunit